MEKTSLIFPKKETWLNRQNMQMVFQDPLASFDPKMKIVDILTEPLINYGKLKRSEKESKARVTPENGTSFLKILQTAIPIT